MEPKGLPRFCRRPSVDGDIVSFCTRCYVVVAQGRDYKQLESGEREHQCDPRMLEHWQTLLTNSRPEGEADNL